MSVGGDGFETDRRASARHLRSHPEQPATGATRLTTVVNAWDDRKTADEAIAALREEGFEDRQVRILKGDAARIVSPISERGFEDDDARAHADAADRGRTLVVADMSEEGADRVVSVTDRVVATRRSSAESRAGSVPIVEERFSGGEAKSVAGGARVASSVGETPVEETMAAERVLGAEEAEAAFQEKTVEMMGTQEEVGLHKQARVAGEVELTGATAGRQETVRGTVRKTEVEQVGAGVTRT